MFKYFQNRFHIFILLCAYFLGLVVPLSPVYSQNVPFLGLPQPGQMIHPSRPFELPSLRGLKIYSDQPMHFDFILDPGNSNLTPDELEKESIKLIKYFLVALALPEDDLWVNLSPYERERVSTNELGQTEMGKDLLKLDYILKQLTASLIYPENGLGQEFWNKIYTKAQSLYGNTSIPVNTFNKVWIVPSEAVVYEYQDTAFISERRLKVMLDGDYLALK